MRLGPYTWDWYVTFLFLFTNGLTNPLCCNIVLMYIHRSFFAQAIIEHPVNPLKSTYAPSFLAAYRASSTILKSIREQFNMWPNSCSRFWTMWTSAFSAAVCIYFLSLMEVKHGLIFVFFFLGCFWDRRDSWASFSPCSTSDGWTGTGVYLIFKGVFIQYKSYESFSTSSSQSFSLILITFIKAILTKLNEKARHALATTQRDPSPVMSSDGGLLWNIKKEDTDDELSILAGHTRLVSTQRGSRHPSPSRQYNPSPPLFPAAGQLPHHKSHDSLDHLSQPHLPLNVPPAYTHLQHTPPRLSHASSISDPWVSSSIPSERSQQYQGGLGVEERLPSHYTYVTSAGHHQQSENSTALSTYGWSNDPRLQHHAHNQSQRCLSSASSSSSCTAAHQLPSSQQPPGHAHQSPTNSQHQLHQNEHQPQYHAHTTHVGSGSGSPLDVPSSAHHSHVYSSHNPNDQTLLTDLPPLATPARAHDQQQQQQHPNVYSMYGSSSSSHSNPRSSVYHGIHPQTQTAPSNMELANLGLASRDSRLDERWVSRWLEGFFWDEAPRLVFFLLFPNWSFVFIFSFVNILL